MYKSEMKLRKVVTGFRYRGLYYEIVLRIIHSELGSNYYCAYFYLPLHIVDLNINFQEEISGVTENRFSACAFLDSKTVNELEKEAHWAFTFAQHVVVTTHENQSLLDTEILELGVDYNHFDDEGAGHCEESICKDCEKVIDKIHSMGVFKGDENE